DHGSVAPKLVLVVACRSHRGERTYRRRVGPSRLGAMTQLTFTGGCNCGGVRFEIDGPLDGHASYCHCTRCQRRSGTAASPQVRIAGSAFRLVSGEELVREWTPPDGWPKCF